MKPSISWGPDLVLLTGDNKMLSRCHLLHLSSLAAPHRYTFTKNKGQQKLKYYRGTR